MRRANFRGKVDFFDILTFFRVRGVCKTVPFGFVLSQLLLDVGCWCVCVGGGGLLDGVDDLLVDGGCC